MERPGVQERGAKRKKLRAFSLQVVVGTQAVFSRF